MKTNQGDLAADIIGKRICSVDAFRGFIMMAMLMGTFGLKELSQHPVWGFFYRQLNHAPWRGFTFEDIILPLFLWIIGVAMSLSDAKRRKTSEGFATRLRHALKRAIILFVLGFMMSWLNAGKPYFGAGVLQILAVSYFVSFLFLSKSIKIQAFAFASLLFIYWFFIFIIPVPGAGRNSYVLYKNLVFYLDETIIGTATRWGYLYTVITSSAVVMYGSIIGKLLIRKRSDTKFMKTLAILGAAGIAGGLILNPFVPIIKRMFTSSYTLFTCGLITLLFGLFYWMIDMKGWKKPGFIFVVFGMNSIFVYSVHIFLGKWLLETTGVYTVTLATILGGGLGPLQAFLRLLAEWLLCFWLYRKQIFIKI
ncbi:MAG: acyltransferase family protein [Planctomycetota bacterium]